MTAWSTAAVAAIAVAALVAPRLRRAAIQRRSDRALRAKAEERERRRRPAEGSLVLEGRVVNDAASPGQVVTRREFGCLGGPLMHDVSVFVLETDAGEHVTVAVGADPVVENLDGLARSPALTDRPLPTGAPDSIRALAGRVRVAGVLAAGPGHVAPTPGCSAVLTILSDPHA